MKAHTLALVLAFMSHFDDGVFDFGNGQLVVIKTAKIGSC